MIRLHYISPSNLPSRTANSIHVVHQCGALRDAGAEVILYAKRSLVKADDLPGALRAMYGVSPESLRLVTFHSSGSRGDSARIAAMAFASCVRSPGDVVLSRNLYAAYVLGVVFGWPIIYETHQLEYGFRKRLQRALVSSGRVKTVAVSRRLVACLEEHLELSGACVTVLHDAAPEGIVRVPPCDRRRSISEQVGSDLSAWDMVCGYFGHLYPGRGIELIESLAGRLPRCLFLVYGGNESDLAARRKSNVLSNLMFMGHVPHPVAQSAMGSVDALLMPYQRQVSIGISGHDTARWMSPMKMFEYLAAGVPLVSSDLPVLREVLLDGHNCLLVPSDDCGAWEVALQRLMDFPQLADAIGSSAHLDYVERHTWRKRAEALLDLALCP